MEEEEDADEEEEEAEEEEEVNREVAVITLADQLLLEDPWTSLIKTFMYTWWAS